MKRFFQLLGGKKKPATPAAPVLRTMAQLDAMIAEGGLEAAGDAIRRRVLPCVHVIAEGVGADTPGVTRFGGAPDLPAGSVWPMTPAGVPLQFLAQIDLGEMQKQVGETALPGEGLLSIFADDLDGPWETRAAVFLMPPATALERMTPPMDRSETYPAAQPLKPVTVRFERGLTIPENDAGLEEEILRLAPEGELDALQTSPPAGRNIAIGQILGHAPSTQERLQSQIALAELGYPGKENLLTWTSWEDWEGAKTMEHRLKGGMIHRPWRAADDGVVRWMLDNRELIARETEQWQILLMVSSNKPMDLWINDADPIFVFIRSDDLKARNFARLRVVATQS